jgi:hypothetical protein
VAAQTAVALLNRLPPGARLPLLVYFPAPLPAAYTPRAELSGALPIALGDTRYLTATLTLDPLDLPPNPLTADLSGVVTFPPLPRQPRLVWVVAAAYDALDQPIAARRWALPAPCGALPSTPAAAPTSAAPAAPVACPPVPFAFTLYSLGPAIDHVEVLVEVR